MHTQTRFHLKTFDHRMTSFIIIHNLIVLRTWDTHNNHALFCSMYWDFPPDFDECNENQTSYFHSMLAIDKLYIWSLIWINMYFLVAGFSIFFEFKHFKPKKNMISTKCWAFMEKDEIKEGPVALELYVYQVDIFHVFSSP